MDAQYYFWLSGLHFFIASGISSVSISFQLFFYLRFLSLVAVIFFLLTFSSFAEDLKIKYRADKVEYLNSQKMFRLIGHVELQARDFVITSETLDYDTQKKILISQGPFEIVQKTSEQKPRTLKGVNLLYDLGLKRIEADNVYLVIPAQSPGQEVYIQGEHMTAYDDGKRVVFSQGFYTTCNHFDREHQLKFDIHSPQEMKKQITHYAIQAEVLDFIDNDRIIAWNTEIIAYEKKIFWFPFWLIPLQGTKGFRQPDLDVGQNAIEGVFSKFKGYYHWNDFHDGYWYLTLMEKKGVGLGFQHDWIAFPNSITRFYFYGLPVTKDLLGVVPSFFSSPDDQISAQEQNSGLQIQQSPLSPSGINAISNWFRNKFTDREIEIRHKQRLLPFTEAEILYNDRDFYNTSAFQAARNPTRRLEFQLTDNQLLSLDSDTELRLDTRLSLNQSVNSPFDVKYRVEQDKIIRTEETRYSGTQNRTASISSSLGEAILNLRTNWTENTNSVRTQVFQNNQLLEAQSSSSPVQGNELWNTTLDFNLPLNEKAKLTANFIYNSNTSGIVSGSNPGTLIQTLQPRLNITQSLDWGNINLSYEDFFNLSSDLLSARNQSTGQIKKLPELDLKFNPFFQDTFPVQLETRFGRYFDPAIPSQALTQFNLNEISRTLIRLSLMSKDYDLGMGMKVNFGGTNFEQRLYQTQDAEYIFTARAHLRNELSSYFIPQLNYERTVQDLVNNNSPFVNFEPLQLRNINNLTFSLNLFNLPEFTWTFNGGYDYLNRSYQPIRSDIISQIGNQFILRANTSYTPIHITDADIGKPLKDSDGNIYRHGDSVNGPTIIVKPEDVGGFSPYAGRWGITTLGIRWRSNDQVFATGALSTFGLDQGIPEGFEIGGDIAYDFHQGRINGLNGLIRWAFGDNWLWHTEMDLIFSVQPTTIPTNFEELNALVIPFRLIVRKDLHDFILTMSWDSFYQQFNLNLSMLAFPFNTSDLTSNLGSLSQQFNTFGGNFR